ncbi:hypothetical protein CoNPh17_CDS0204 [Staphylococcus phage S-CoN_Ph17]|nr:hypothetical protein CoNPh17_CDS0204 [Staphylococcus phage S-CoN_Ph17]
MVKKVLNGIIISKTVGKRLNRLLETLKKYWCWTRRVVW